MTDTTRGTRPTTVTISFVLWLITILLGLVGAVILFVLSGNAEMTGSTETSTGMGTAVYLTAAIVAIVLAVIQLIVVFKMRAGRNWARIVLLILAVLQVAGVVTQPATSNVSSWASLVAVIIATVLMFLPASNPYFTHKARRA